MKKSNTIFGVILGILIACLLSTFISRNKNSSDGNTAGSGTVRKIKIAHSLPTTHPVHQGLEHFSKRLEALSGGKMSSTIFPSGQLGNETEYLEKLQSGSLDIAKTSAGPIANFVPRMKVFSLPYLFRDREHYWAVLDGEIGHSLLEKISDLGDGSASGFRGLTFYDAGSRNFYTKEKVESPDDLKGLTIRVMKDPVAIAMIEAMGATAKPMSGGEIYSALERGNIQGAENNPPTFMKDGHYEVCKHFTFDHHSRIPDILSISDTLWNKLSLQEREWVATAARESSQFQRQLWEKASDEATAAMKKNGVTIYHPEISLFEEAAKPATQKFLTGEVKELAEQIQSTSKE